MLTLQARDAAAVIQQVLTFQETPVCGAPCCNAVSLSAFMRICLASLDLSLLNSAPVPRRRPSGVYQAAWGVFLELVGSSPNPAVQQFCARALSDKVHREWSTLSQDQRSSLKTTLWQLFVARGRGAWQHRITDYYRISQRLQWQGCSPSPPPPVKHQRVFPVRTSHTLDSIV